MEWEIYDGGLGGKGSKYRMGAFFFWLVSGRKLLFYPPPPFPKTEEENEILERVRCINKQKYIFFLELRGWGEERK